MITYARTSRQYWLWNNQGLCTHSRSLHGSFGISCHHCTYQPSYTRRHLCSERKFCITLSKKLRWKEIKVFLQCSKPVEHSLWLALQQNPKVVRQEASETFIGYCKNWAEVMEPSITYASVIHSTKALLTWRTRWSSWGGWRRWRRYGHQKHVICQFQKLVASEILECYISEAGY